MMFYDEKDHRLEVLRTAYAEIHSHIRAGESIENKVAFAASALLMVFSVLLLRRFIIPTSLYELGVLLFFVPIITGVTVLFLNENSRRIKFQCRMVVQIEHLMGLYEPEFFIEKRFLPSSLLHLQESTALPENAKNWGLKSITRLSVIWHISAVILSGFVAIGSVFIESEGLLFHNNRIVAESDPAKSIDFNSLKMSLSDATAQRLLAVISGAEHSPDPKGSSYLESHARQIEDLLKRIESDVQKIAFERSIAPAPGSVALPSSSPLQIAFGPAQTSLNAQALQTISRVANSSKMATEILCNGYSDPTGSETAKGQIANMRFSILRAANVAAQLAQDGIPIEKITVKGYGSQRQSPMVEIVVK